MEHLEGQWYHVPEFNGYIINQVTGKILSFKNYKADPFHEMQVDKHGYITLSHDIKGSVKVRPKDVYDSTFGNGQNPIPFSDGIYMGGRQRMSKKMKNPIAMDFSKYVNN